MNYIIKNFINKYIIFFENIIIDERMLWERKIKYDFSFNLNIIYKLWYEIDWEIEVIRRKIWDLNNLSLLKIDLYWLIDDFQMIEYRKMIKTLSFINKIILKINLYIQNNNKYKNINKILIEIYFK